MYKGARAIHAAVTFLVYRPTPEQLTHACQMLSHSFGSAKVLRERNIAWQLWLETLPITVSWLLHSSSLINERRLTLALFCHSGKIKIRAKFLTVDRASL